MIRTLFYHPDQPLRTNLAAEEYQSLLQSPDGLLWVDFSEEPPEICEPILRSFGFHPLSIDDALQERHVPKLDDWGNYLYIVLNIINLITESDHWETEVEELDMFLGQNFVVTHHDLPLAVIDEAWEACQRDERHLHQGGDHLAYKIIDTLTTDYMHFVERIDDTLDELENQIFDRPTPKTLENLFALKRILLNMRRIILPEREVLNKLARDDYQVIDPKDRVFFRDIYDHMVRLHDLNESMRDVVGGALDTYLSVVNNRMNEVMKTLTVITTLFMPLSFLAGFFGMNFFLPRTGDAIWEVVQRPVFYLSIPAFIITPVLMYRWMRSRTWI
jgi:magnesium transporter